MAGVSCCLKNLAYNFLNGDTMEKPTLNAIFNAIDAYVKNSQFTNVETVNRKFIRVILGSIKNSRVAIEKRYEEINKQTKDNFMEIEQEETIKLDRHKCSAAFMIAFLEKNKF